MLNIDIDRVPEKDNFKVYTWDFNETSYKEKVLDYYYPCVYIIENGKDAYIGITGDIKSRINQHVSNREKQKYKFKKIHIITGLQSELSVVIHYESILIRLMVIDKRFNIVNKYKGQEKNHYPRKNKFEIYFDRLWPELENKNLVCKKDLKIILNNNAYKYSPFVMLNKEQEKALKSIINTLGAEDTLPQFDAYKARPIVVTGGAGTGKTLVATSLLYYLKHDERYKNKRIALVIACTSLRTELKEVFKQNGMSKSYVISPTEVTHYDKNTKKLRHYDILICDEAHKLRSIRNQYSYAKAFTEANKRLGFDNTHNELDWMLVQCDFLILFYDKHQNTSPCDVMPSDFDKKIFQNKSRGFRPIEEIKLVTQMRVQAGDNYVQYIMDILNQKASNKLNFDTYQFGIVKSFGTLIQIIQEKEAQSGLSRLCGGYGWEWKSKEDRTLFDIVIDDHGVPWNSTRNCWLTNLALKNEMGSGYTLQGFDLNYAGVVFGPEIQYNDITNEIEINRESFYDSTLKRGTNDEDLKRYVLNTYAVLLTRAIWGTYIYVCDEKLRRYLSSFIEPLD